MTSLRFATVQLPTGPRLHYAEQGDADGEPAVFLHGWPDSWFTFSRVFPLYRMLSLIRRTTRNVVPATSPPVRLVQ